MSSIFSCGLPYDRLNDGRGNKVPKKNYVFKNTHKIDSNILKDEIDINFFYKRIRYYESNKNYEIVFNKSYEDQYNLTIQFYTNSRIRWGVNTPSPETSGHRGIVYNESGKLYSDIFLGRADNIMHIANFKIKAQQDTLYFLGTNRIIGNTCHVFVKSNKIPKEYKRYNANW